MSRRSTRATGSSCSRMDCAGFGEAETRVERYLRRYPDRTVAVYIAGKLAYHVEDSTNGTTTIRRGHRTMYRRRTA